MNPQQALHSVWWFLSTPAGGAFIFWVLSAGATSMPAPLPNGSRLYLWFYGFAQLLMANLDKSGIRIVASAPAQNAVPPTYTVTAQNIAPPQ